MKYWVPIALALFANACTDGKTGCPQLPGGAPYCLQAAAGTPLSLLQKTTLRFGTQSLTLLTRIESDQQGMRFVGLTPFGQTLMSVSWENGSIRADLPPAMQGRLDPALLLALVQLAQWPEEAVRRGLGEQWELTESAGRRSLKLASQEHIMLDILREGPPPYHRLRIEAPGLGFQMEAVRLLENDNEEKQ